MRVNTVAGVRVIAGFPLRDWRGSSRPPISSGNLHPIEAYVIARGLSLLADGVYHYAPDAHLLERRASWTMPSEAPPGLFIALSSAMWREAWKYGERAFRYCQLDAGHAVGGLALVAALLGARVSEQTDLDALGLERLLGLDRLDDLLSALQAPCRPPGVCRC